jgi:glycosyltransferase involved in cell wall biosynthesis
MSDATTIRNRSDANSISVFFPCYNEQDNVHRLYESASQVLSAAQLDYELIFIDDGSRDRTPAILDAFAAKDARVRVIHHASNLGYGSALRAGFGAASKTLVFYTDADGQFDLKELPSLIPLMQEYDIVSCFRLDRTDGTVRKFNAWCWSKLVCLVFRMKFRDINCAYKLYKRDIFDRFKLRSTGALINAEILARTVRCGCIVTQVGVHHFPRIGGQQTGAKPRVIIRALWELIRLYRRIVSE